MGRNLFVYLVFTVRVLNTPIFRRKLHICTALHGRTQNAEPYSMEYPMEYLKWSTPKSHVLVK